MIVAGSDNICEDAVAPITMLYVTSFSRPVVLEGHGIRCVKVVESAFLICLISLFMAIHFLKACSLIVNSVVDVINRMMSCCNS